MEKPKVQQPSTAFATSSRACHAATNPAVRGWSTYERSYGARAEKTKAGGGGWPACRSAGPLFERSFGSSPCHFKADMTPFYPVTKAPAQQKHVSLADSTCSGRCPGTAKNTWRTVQDFGGMQTASSGNSSNAKFPRPPATCHVRIDGCTCRLDNPCKLQAPQTGAHQYVILRSSAVRYSQLSPTP